MNGDGSSYNPEAREYHRSPSMHMILVIDHPIDRRFDGIHGQRIHPRHHLRHPGKFFLAHAVSQDRTMLGVGHDIPQYIVELIVRRGGDHAEEASVRVDN